MNLLTELCGKIGYFDGQFRNLGINMNKVTKNITLKK